MTLEREHISPELERPTRIGISGSYGGMNLGDEAILQSIMAQLRRRMPVEVVVFSMDRADTLARHDVEQALPVRELSRAEVTEEFEGLDLLILGGGGLLYNGEARHYVREMREEHASTERPQVLVGADYGRLPEVDLVVKNIGRGAAKDISFE